MLFKGFQLFDMCVEKNVVIRDLTVGLFQRADTAAAMGNMFASLFQVKTSMFSIIRNVKAMFMKDSAIERIRHNQVFWLHAGGEEGEESF